MKTIVIALMLVLGAGSGVMSQNAKLKKTKAYFEEVREATEMKYMFSLTTTQTMS
jgi:hypothetical protein